MARHKLTEKACKGLDQPGIYGDGDGLWLRVRPGGSKQFLFVYIEAGKRKEMGLGGYGGGTKPVSLALARQKAEAIREARARGEDPKADRTRKVVTFKDMMDDTIAVKIKSFRNAKHRDQWSMTLITYAADLHAKPIASITVDDVVRVLQPIWETIPETANRTRMRIASVINHAKARGLYKGDNPAAWRGALEHLLSERQTLSRGHHAALAFRDVPAMMKKIQQSSSVSASAVEFACLTAARSGEVRGAVWSEFDLENGLWIVPAERMKAGKEHRVPLTKRAVEILTARLEARTAALVFEGGKEGAAISDTAMTKSLRSASGDKKATLHGLRSSFRDWAGDETGHARDVIEAALAHALKDKTEAAYRRSDALQKRRLLMDEWESYCAQ